MQRYDVAVQKFRATDSAEDAERLARELGERARKRKERRWGKRRQTKDAMSCCSAAVKDVSREAEVVKGCVCRLASRLTRPALAAPLPAPRPRRQGDCPQGADPRRRPWQGHLQLGPEERRPPDGRVRPLHVLWLSHAPRLAFPFCPPPPHAVVPHVSSAAPQRWASCASRCLATS